MWIEKGKDLQPKKLIPSLIQCNQPAAAESDQVILLSPWQYSQHLYNHTYSNGHALISSPYNEHSSYTEMYSHSRGGSRGWKEEG